MTQSEEIQDLFARYAAEVGRHLPRRSREDIEKELAAAMADRLDDLAARESREATLEDAVALLKEAGHPRWTAASYLKHGHLVGPELFLLFSMVCRIVLPIVFAVTVGAQALAVALGNAAAGTIAETVLRILGSSVGGALQMLAVIVIVFTVLERVGPVDRIRSTLDPWSPWDPRDLPKPEDPGRISLSEQVLTVVFGAVFLVFLAFLPSLLEAGVRNAGIPGVRLGLSAGLLRLLPLFYASTAADILVAGFLLTRRVHSAATVTMKAASKALSVITAGFLLAVWPFLSLQSGAMAEADMGVLVVNWIIRVGCVLGIVAGSFDLARGIVRFARGRRTAV